MASIFPETTAGGVVVRDAAGVCQNPSNVANAYCPPATFQTSCEIRALPSDCTARIEPRQINAFQSEMLCLAATLDPDGTWNCGSLCNLSTAWSNWVNGTGSNTLEDRIGDILCDGTDRAANQPNDRLLACDGSGGTFKTPISSLFDLDRLGDILCSAAFDNTPEPGSGVIYCDGDGDIFKIDMSEIGCDCPPVEITGTPVAPPTESGPNRVPWRVDITDPANRLLYYWNGTAWNLIRREPDLLFGNLEIAAGPDLEPMPDTGFARTQMHAADFTIPNTGPRDIVVRLNLHLHTQTDIDPTVDQVQISAFTYSGPGITGTVINETHENWGSAPGGGQRFDVLKTSALDHVIIPPGGRTLSVEFVLWSAIGAGAAVRRIRSAQYRIDWYGVSGTPRN